VQAASLPEELRTRSHCPSCGGGLTRSVTADPWAICLSCPADHRFFVMPAAPLALETARAASAHFPELEGRQPAEIASFWLSDPFCRSILNEQLAELLRAILEARPRSDSPRFLRCPLCGTELSEYDQPDVWVRGLRCARDHTWAERGGRLDGVVTSAPFSLRAEPSDGVVRQLVAGWLSGNPQLGSDLHESVRNVLASSVFAERDA